MCESHDFFGLLALRKHYLFPNLVLSVLSVGELASPQS
jgi:hypothetical protein